MTSYHSRDGNHAAPAQLSHRVRLPDRGCGHVRLSLSDQFIDFDARVDTGASFCIFNRGYAEALGIDVEAGQAVQVGTATGTFDAFGHTLTLTTLGLGFEAVVYFARDSAFRRNVLGRRGWLDRVRLGLIDYDGRVYLSGYDDAE